MPAVLEQVDLAFREVPGGLEYDAPSSLDGRIMPMRLYDGIEPTAQVRQLLRAAQELRNAADPEAYNALKAKVDETMRLWAADVERVRQAARGEIAQAEEKCEEEVNGIAAVLVEAQLGFKAAAATIIELEAKIASMEAAVAETDQLKAKLKDSDFHRERLGKRNGELEEDLTRLRNKRK